MSGSNSVPPSSESCAAAQVERAEQRLAMLRRLAELGMKMAEDLAGRTPPAAEDPEPRHDRAESFSRVSRAVRLTLALEAKVDQELSALRNGEATLDGDRGAPPSPDEDPPFGKVPKDHPSAHRNRIRDSVWDVIDHEITDLLPAHEALDDLHERLTEGERYDAFVFRPLRESVEAICGDLGLTPDWSRWTDAGFPPETRTTRYDWPDLWVYHRPHADQRRRENAARETAACSPAAAAPPDPHSRQ